MFINRHHFNYITFHKSKLQGLDLGHKCYVSKFWNLDMEFRNF